ncbi:MAG: hypothetical protein K5924_02555 [Chloroflexi bacterium]|nr:hypothetical protein [Chloroflexota bacterium]
MRSAATPVLVILGLASLVLLLLVLLWTIGLRGDLESARGEVADLRAQVETMERGVPMSALSMRLAELENDIEEWVVAFSSDVPSNGGTGGGTADTQLILDQLDRVLDRIEALDNRVDEICESVPVC